MSELQNKINIGLKRLTLVCCLWTLIVSIPMIIWTNEINKLPEWWRVGTIVTWLLIIDIGILISPKLVSKIWKNA